MALWILATIFAFFIKGLCGFANTLVFTSILGFGTDNVIISPVELILGFPTNLIMSWKNRTKLKPEIYVPLSILVIAGSIPGAFLLKNINANILKAIFGLVVILTGLEMIFRKKNDTKIKNSRIIMAVIAVLSGILCGLFGIGALLAAYISRVTNSSDEFKANISAVFIVDNLFRLTLYSIIGVITIASIKRAFVLAPFMLAGIWLGIKCADLLNEYIVKQLVSGLLVISGIALVVMNI